jgi:hypothetical protein
MSTAEVGEQTVDEQEAIRRRNVASYDLDPQWAAELLAFMRERGVTEWPPPPPTREQRPQVWEGPAPGDDRRMWTVRERSRRPRAVIHLRIR